MKRFFRLIAAAVAAGAVLSGCAKKAEPATNENEKLFFDSWMQVHHPQTEKTGLGIYIIDENITEEGQKEPVADSQYVYVSYTARDLDGNITSYSEAETAEMLGEDVENSSRYYGPVVWTRIPGYIYAGVGEMLTGLGRGDSRTAVIPGWLMSYASYGTEQEYLNKETGSNSIYEIKVVDPIDNIRQWQIDSIGTFLSGAYADYDFGYLNSTLKEKLGENILSAKDSSDMYGFYFIEIEKGEELKPVDDEQEEDGEDSEEEDKYDWEKSHFYTVSGSNDTTIYINYVGRLLNGKVFDTNIQRVAQDNGLSGGTYKPSAIQWGDSFYALEMGDEGSSSSIIQGFAMTLWRMHPMGKAIGIFYSDFGYGATGSSSTIPAYSPLMFEIEIVEKPSN